MPTKKEKKNPKLRKDLDDIFDRINLENKSRKVKIKFRKLKGAYSIFFKYWNGYKHEYEFWEEKFFGFEKTKLYDDDLLREVEKVRLDKDSQCRNNNYFVLKNNEEKADFIKFYKKVGEKRKSRPQYVTSLQHFKKFIGRDEIKFRDLSPALFKDFREYLLTLKVEIKDQPKKHKLAMKPITARGYLDVMRAGLNLAIEEQIINTNPLNGIDIKVDETKREHLTENELKDFIKKETDYEEIKQAFLFSCFTGLRLGDIQTLTFENFEDNNLLFKQQKTSKHEAFPLAFDALKIYFDQKKLHSNKGSVFKLPHKSKINAHLKTMAKKAGIEKNLHYHMSRHTFAILCLTNGMSIYEVSKFLGHTDIKTTEIYLKFIPEHKKEAISKLPSFLK